MYLDKHTQLEGELQGFIDWVRLEKRLKDLKDREKTRELIYAFLQIPRNERPRGLSASDLYFFGHGKKSILEGCKMSYNNSLDK